MIAIEPKAELIEMFREAGGSGPGVAQIPVCYGPEEDECRRLALEQFRWAVNGWKVNAELPNPVNFDGATQLVREEDIASLIPSGPDTEGIIEGVKQFVEAGIEQVALVQVCDRQKEFCEFFECEGALGLGGDGRAAAECASCLRQDRSSPPQVAFVLQPSTAMSAKSRQGQEKPSR